MVVISGTSDAIWVFDFSCLCAKDCEWKNAHIDMNFISTDSYQCPQGHGEHFKLIDCDLNVWVFPACTNTCCESMRAYINVKFIPIDSYWLPWRYSEWLKLIGLHLSVWIFAPQCQGTWAIEAIYWQKFFIYRLILMPWDDSSQLEIISTMSTVASTQCFFPCFLLFAYLDLHGLWLWNVGVPWCCHKSYSRPLT
jgi:hypothetical protein